MQTPPSTAEPTNRPERDGAGVPEGIARLLHLIRWIIGYGKTCADTLHQRSAAEFRAFAERYRRTDFNEILARIKRGLMLAAAFEAKLLKRASTGRDVVEVPVRYAMPGRKRSAAKSKRARAENIVDMPADRLPTAEQIAAELRRRPIGAVLVDICRDLGIERSDLTEEQWQELRDAILMYGGQFAVLFNAESKIRMRPLLDEALGKTRPAPAPAAPAQVETVCPTGPPPLALAV